MDLDGESVFGGFGVDFERIQVNSKVENWHNRQDSGVSLDYPSILQLVDNKEYKFFISFRIDRISQEVVLNAWLDIANGNGWVQVMKDRKWGQSGWSPGSVPEGEDKEEILNGPSFIKKHHIWTRANSLVGGVVLPIKDIRIGTIGFIS
jgi:hypothetical protein